MAGSATKKAPSTQESERQSTLTKTEEYNAVKKKVASKCQQTMQYCGVPKRFLNASMHDFPKKYSDQFRTDTGLYLCGPRGCGKTHLMAAMIREEILNAEPDVFYSESCAPYCYEPTNFPLLINVPEFLLQIRSTFGQRYLDAEYPPDTEAEILKKYSNQRVLYIDDLGAEKASDWAVSTLYVLIDRRYTAMRRTVISSNLSLDELADRLDDRISSRIAGSSLVVKMTGSDRRLK
jgi:DNA replication protein DnaC